MDKYKITITSEKIDKFNGVLFKPVFTYKNQEEKDYMYGIFQKLEPVLRECYIGDLITTVNIASQ